MNLFCSAFHDGDAIPPKFTCDSEDVSPPLEWSGVPASAKTLVLIVDDPDAPRGLFLHWLLYDLPATENGLTEGVGIEESEAGGASQGKNSFGRLGYGGPCPPSGTHRYYFRLFALDQSLGLPGGASRQEVEAAMEGHVLAEAQLMGRYQRRAA